MTLLNPPISLESLRKYNDPFESVDIPESLVENPAVGDLGGVALKSIIVDPHEAAIKKAMAGFDMAMEDLKKPIPTGHLSDESFDSFNSTPHNFHDGL